MPYQISVFDENEKPVTKKDDDGKEVIEPIERCNATKTNPQNGIRDVDTLQILRDNFQHQNFGVYCKVLSDGEIELGDRVKVNSN